MEKIAIVALCCILSGCITQTTVGDNEEPLVTPEFNANEAAQLRIALGLKYLNSGNMSQAKYNLEKALEFAPDSAKANYSLAYYYQQVGEFAKADSFYQRSLAIEPDESDARNNYGVFLCQQKKPVQAIKEFKKAIANPKYIRVAESYENMALCALQAGLNQQARNYFQQSINHEENRVSTLVNYSEFLLIHNDLATAEVMVERLLKIGLRPQDTLWLAARLYKAQGKNAQAQQMLDSLLILNPGHLGAISWDSKSTTNRVESVAREETDKKIHVVKSGENLFSISVKYNIRMETLRKWNNLTENSTIFVGQKLKLSPPEHH